MESTVSKQVRKIPTTHYIFGPSHDFLTKKLVCPNVVFWISNDRGPHSQVKFKLPNRNNANNTSFKQLKWMAQDLELPLY